MKSNTIYDSKGDVHNGYTVKPVLSDHIKQDFFLAFQTDGCLFAA